MPHHPGLATVAGHLLDTIFSDTLNADLERMNRINKTVDTLNAHNIPTDLKKVESFLINPSANFNEIASQHFLQLPMAVRSLLRLTGITQHSESSLTSYLLFEKSYTKRLIEIGYQDAIQQMPELLDFLRS